MKKVFLLRAFLVISIFYPAIAPFASAGVGEALYERWDEAGTADSMLTESSTPNYTEIITSTQWGVGDDNSLENYRGRITAFLIPPVTGEYIFWIVTDDNGRLWLSTDHDPNNAQLIASESSWAAENAWGGVGDEAQSVVITLQGGKPYWLRGGYQETGGGDHIQIAWACTDAGIADHTIIEGKYLTTDPDIFYFYAYSPNPVDGAVNVKVEDVQLSWTAPILIPEATYSVYFGDPNVGMPLLDSGLTETTIDVGDLDTDTTYSWRVDVLDPNEGGNPTVNEGPVWSFTTAPDTPVIVSQPKGVSLFAGETVIFTIDAYSANDEPLTYAWFKETEPGTILSDTDTLTITNVQGDDEGAYLCTLTNTYGSVTSEPASLIIKRLVGHWPFNQDVTDIVGGNDGTVKQPVYVEGIVDDWAIEFSNAGGASGVDISTVPYTTPSWTISFWEKASTEDAGEEEVIVGSGETGWELLDIGRWASQLYYVGLNDTYVYFLADVYPRGQWNMVALTYDVTAQQGTLYINGVSLLELSVAFPGFDPGLNLIVGDVADWEYYGAVDDLRFYNYVLEPLDVAVLYTDISGETVCFQNPEADVSGPEGKPDCVVSIYDLVEVVGAWLECNRIPAESCL
jgi:hypothetical protein